MIFVSLLRRLLPSAPAGSQAHGCGPRRLLRRLVPAAGLVGNAFQRFPKHYRLDIRLQKLRNSNIKAHLLCSFVTIPSHVMIYGMMRILHLYSRPSLFASTSYLRFFSVLTVCRRDGFPLPLYVTELLLN